MGSRLKGKKRKTDKQLELRRDSCATKEERNKLLNRWYNKYERKRIAFHEASHATMAWFLRVGGDVDHLEVFSFRQAREANIGGRWNNGEAFSGSFSLSTCIAAELLDSQVGDGTLSHTRKLETAETRSTVEVAHRLIMIYLAGEIYDRQVEDETETVKGWGYDNFTDAAFEQEKAVDENFKPNQIGRITDLGQTDEMIALLVPDNNREIAESLLDKKNDNPSVKAARWRLILKLIGRTEQAHRLLEPWTKKTGSKLIREKRIRRVANFLGKINCPRFHPTESVLQSRMKIYVGSHG